MALDPGVVNLARYHAISVSVDGYIEGEFLRGERPQASYSRIASPISSLSWLVVVNRRLAQSIYACAMFR